MPILACLCRNVSQLPETTGTTSEKSHKNSGQTRAVRQSSKPRVRSPDLTTTQLLPSPPPPPLSSRPLHLSLLRKEGALSPEHTYLSPVQKRKVRYLKACPIFRRRRSQPLPLPDLLRCNRDLLNNDTVACGSQYSIIDESQNHWDSRKDPNSHVYETIRWDDEAFLQSPESTSPPSPPCCSSYPSSPATPVGVVKTQSRRLHLSIRNLVEQFENVAPSENVQSPRKWLEAEGCSFLEDPAPGPSDVEDRANTGFCEDVSDNSDTPDTSLLLVEDADSVGVRNRRWLATAPISGSHYGHKYKSRILPDSSKGCSSRASTTTTNEHFSNTLSSTSASQDMERLAHNLATDTSKSRSRSMNSKTLFNCSPPRILNKSGEIKSIRGAAHRRGEHRQGGRLSAKRMTMMKTESRNKAEQQSRRRKLAAGSGAKLRRHVACSSTPLSAPRSGQRLVDTKAPPKLRDEAVTPEAHIKPRDELANPEALRLESRDEILRSGQQLEDQCVTSGRDVSRQRQRHVRATSLGRGQCRTALSQWMDKVRVKPA